MSKSKQYRMPIEPLRWEANDPLAAEHALVARFVNESLKDGSLSGIEIALDVTEAGKEIRDADPVATARIVLALVAHAAHFDELGKEVRALAANEMERINWHYSCPEWEAVWPARQVSAQALRRLLRRKLPLAAEHLTKLADWIAATDRLDDYCYPLNAFTKAVEAYGQPASNETALRASLGRVVQAFRNSHWKELPKLAQRIESLLGKATASKDEQPIQYRPSDPDPSQPAPAGSPSVLVQLKQFLAISTETAPAAFETVGLDRFPLRADSPFRKEHELIGMFLPEVVGSRGYDNPDLTRSEVGQAMVSREALANGSLLLALAERCANISFSESRGALEDYDHWQSQYAISALFRQILQRQPTLNREEVFDVLLFLSALAEYRWVEHLGSVEKLIPQVEQLSASGPLTPGERHVLHRLRCQSVRTAAFGRPTQNVVRISSMLRDHLCLGLVPGEAWSDAVNRELSAMPAPTREKWLGLLEHAASASSSRPSARWIKAAKGHLDEVGVRNFSDALLRWFPLLNLPRTVRLLPGGLMSHSDLGGTIHNDNATCLRGLLWLAPEVAAPDLIRAVGAATASCYRKIPGVGPRAVKVGNAGVYALSQIQDPAAVGQLALLKVKVKFGSAQKEIEKAFTAAAERSGLPRDEIEEMSVPSYGLTEVGVCEEKMGDFTARLTVIGSTNTELVWVRPDGKIQRAVPASVKTSWKDDLKELQAAAKDIQQMLPAQRERIDSLFLRRKAWGLPVWRERYLHHPLVGTLARRILWEFKMGEKTTAATWFNGHLVDLDLKPLDLPDEATTVQLWHPIGKTAEEVIAWRSWLDAQRIQQPFKQAHREIYVLTDAERNTRTYSNRYAGHVLKQHQFNALCALRGWKNQLRLMVDAEYAPPTLHLPQWGLRAEFWVEGLGTNYGADTNDSGVYLYLSTDQVRFYEDDASQRTAHAGGGGYHPGYRGEPDEPLPLERIPPLVLSEIMRDVDLFVGVASVGNDPTWNDGGPDGRYRQYWQDYSFGALNASAKTRKEVLERLVPRLKIANRCSFTEKFLVVKGSMRTYKIHLGSGNILMEPNDQYLCIVPRQSGAEEGNVLLPFEGDRTLSIILSKAFLLAEDEKIKDQTILRQIKP